MMLEVAVGCAELVGVAVVAVEATLEERVDPEDVADADVVAEPEGVAVEDMV